MDFGKSMSLFARKSETDIQKQTVRILHHNLPRETKRLIITLISSAAPLTEVK